MASAAPPDEKRTHALDPKRSSPISAPCQLRDETLTHPALAVGGIIGRRNVGHLARRSAHPSTAGRAHHCADALPNPAADGSADHRANDYSNPPTAHQRARSGDDAERHVHAKANHPAAGAAGGPTARHVQRRTAGRR